VPTEILAEIVACHFVRSQWGESWVDGNINASWVTGSINRELRRLSLFPATLIIGSLIPSPSDARPPIRYHVPIERIHAFFAAVNEFEEKRKKYPSLGKSFGCIGAVATDVPLPGRAMKNTISTLKLLRFTELMVKSEAIDDEYIQYLQVLGKSCTRVRKLTLIAESARSILCLPYADSILEMRPNEESCDDTPNCECRNCVSDWEYSDSDSEDEDSGERYNQAYPVPPTMCVNGNSEGLVKVLKGFQGVERLVVDSFYGMWRGILEAPEGEKVKLQELLPSIKYYSFSGPKHVFYFKYD
jgi:hypothetical protein